MTPERERPYYLNANGERRTLSDWSKVTGQPYKRLYARMERGFNDDEIVYGRRTPDCVADPELTVGAWTKPLSFWARFNRTNPVHIRHRLKAGLCHEFAVFGQPKTNRPTTGARLRVGGTVKLCHWWSGRSGVSAIAISRAIENGALSADAIFQSCEK